MKNLLLIAFICLLSFESSAQNVTLTKGETVAYIDKKFREMEDTYTHLVDTTGRFPSRNDKKLTGAVVKLIEDRIFFNYSLSFRPDNSGYPNCFCSYEISFKPANISKIGYLYDLKFLYIQLTNKTGRFKVSCCQFTDMNKDTMESYLLIKINGVDGDYINKITKALLHLRDLLNAEDDPFK